MRLSGDSVKSRASEDRGFTLMELLVGMGLMGIFMAIVTGSMVMMFGSSQHSEATTRTSQEISSAFLWLDAHLRYADYVGDPSQVTADGGNWHVRFSGTDPESTTATCYELRVDQAAGQLQWTTVPTGTWRPLASQVINGSAAVPTAPFAVLRPGDPYPSGTPAASRSELWLSIIVSQGEGPREVRSASNASFIALNSARAGSGTTGACPRPVAP